jgi:glycosyltransferase involved in cell wall biosynthesis
MISIVMPYWQRQAAFERTLDSYRMHYALNGGDLELVVVDDGSPDPVRIPAVPWPVVIERLAPKDYPLNPCVPINRGVAAASSDTIVLTNPEVAHPRPVLWQMAAELAALGPRGYVIAAAWCPEREAWHCHSSCTSAADQGIKQPHGAGLHFCAMLRRELYERAGGFDEGYRPGQAFEDNDWLMRLSYAGARFCLRDDLVVHHHKAGAATRWAPGQHARNRERFVNKWGKVR